MSLTLQQRKALAEAAARRLAQEAERKACAEALRKWFLRVEPTFCEADE